jgi:predicted transcriptional regulator
MVMLVRDLMVPTVLTVSPNDAVAEADRSMRETSDAAAVVLDGEKVVGLLTEKELAQAENDAIVRDVMHKDPLTIEPGASLSEAARLMTEKGQRFIPAVDGGMLVGILSLPDVRKWARKGGDPEADDVQRVLTLEVGGYESQSPRT